MSQDAGQPGDPGFFHRPVMVEEVLADVREVPPGVFVDATVGGGGHAGAVLAARADISLVGIDRDPAALEAAGRALARFGHRAVLRHARFDALDRVLDDLGMAGISGALFDLGVSSAQLDRPARGFSYRADAPLDMRMDPGQARTAADVVNGYDERRLARLFADNGEGRFASRIARAIARARPLATTDELAEVVRSAIPAPARRTGGHPAKRVFQALRIEVNSELEILPGAIDAAIGRLVPGGRLAVLAYHSGEDRIVKDRFLHAASGGCSCPPQLPCACGAQPTARLVRRGSRHAGEAEVASNRRAGSARLRALEKLPPPPAGGPPRREGRS